MARPNPVQSEAFFNETIRLIVSASSERVQLQLIIEFLNSVKGYEDEFESYLIQLFQRLPDFSNPLLFAGLHPHRFQEAVHQLEKCIKGNEELNRSDEFERKILSYKKALAQLYKWIGEHREAEILEEALVVSVKGKQKESLGGVLVPVVEQSGGIKSGRLRRLKIEIIGQSKNQFELKPTFGVIGAEAGSFLEDAEAAAGNLLQESRKGKNKYWIGTAVFDLSHAWHAGRSANLAIAGTFYCEMLRAEELQEYFRLNPAICITGDVDKKGNVLAVEETSLLQKTEAAFFSWAHVLVVPADQLLQTLQIVEHLKSQFPHRELPVVGATHIRELFFDRRLTLYHKTGAISHNLKKAWKRKFSVAGVSLVLVLLLVIGRLVYGPVDRNPVSIEYEGTQLFLKNASGQTLLTKDVGNYMVLGARSETTARYRYSNLIDIDDDGTNEFIWVQQGVNYNNEGSERATLYAGNVEGDTLWSSSFNRYVDYEFHEYIATDRFVIRHVYVEDVDRDGKEEILIVSTHNQYFPCFVTVLDPKTGEKKAEMLHQGFINNLLFRNLDNDPELEIIFTGTNNTHKLGFLGIIKFDELKGQSGSSERYSIYELEKTKELVYLLFPQTILGKTLYGNEGLKTGGNSLFELDEEHFIARITENYEITEDGGRNSVKIQYTFNNKLEVKSVSPMDDYDIKAKELYDKGVLNFIADGKYLQTYKDSLLWWDGEKFVNEPTLANGYGTIGNDSINNESIKN